MKAPKAKQLPSGSWFCRVRVNGQDIGITRATEKEAVAEAMAIKAGIHEAASTHGKDKTVDQAISDYIDARRNILSPATIRGYTTIQRNRFQPVMKTKIGTITPDRWQKIVNTEARTVSAKTIQNSWRFMASVIKETTGEEIIIRTPQVIKSDRPFLEPEQISAFLDAVRGTNVEIPALLALSSLRRSEIFALRWSNVDLKRGVLQVRGAAVPDENHKLVQKTENKNSSSRRTVPIIAPLASALEAVDHKSDFVVTGCPETTARRINRICAANGLPEISLHGLRHSFASLAYHLQIPERVAMEIGGWSTPETMRKIYTHVAQRDREHYASEFTRFFQNGNENDNGK